LARGIVSVFIPAAEELDPVNDEKQASRAVKQERNGTKAAIVTLSMFLLIGCQYVKPNSGTSVAQTNFRDVLDGPGRPRVVTEVTGIKIEEILEAKYKDLDPAFIQVFAERVVQGDSSKTGVRLFMAATATPHVAREANDYATFDLSDAQVRECMNALRQAVQFKPAATATQQYFEWVGSRRVDSDHGKN